MKIVQGDEQPMIGGRTVRAGIIDKQYLLEGEDHSLGNFSFVLAYQDAGSLLLAAASPQLRSVALSARGRVQLR